VLVALVGLGILLSTQVLRATLDDSNCASIVNPDRARECVASSAQSLDRGLLGSMLAIAASITLIAVGALLVARSRRRVVDIVQAATLMEIDVTGVRSLISNGDIVPVLSEGRMYVDAVEVERLARALNEPERMATQGPA
jgi:hypothetical protein